MDTFYFPALPTIFGLQLELWLQILIFCIFFFGVVVLLRYFIVKYRRRKQLDKDLSTMQHESLDMQQKLLIKKMKEAEGKVFLILYVEYLERFTTNKPYSSIEGLLRQQDLDESDVLSILSVLYQDKSMDASLKDKLLHTF